MPRPSRPRGTPAGPGNDDNDEGTSDDDEEGEEGDGDEAGPGVSLAGGSVVTCPAYRGNLPVGEGVSGS
jgi:hypothetical protein